MDKVRPHSTLPTRKIITKRTHSGVRRTKPFPIGEGLEEKYIVHRSCQSPQIYENAAVLKASAFKKDNRIPPKGFVAAHTDYVQMSIQGEAATDNDFNMSNGVEGTGSDIVTYKIPATDNCRYSIGVDICYQTISPANAEHLFGFRSPDIQRFANLYKKSDRKPVVLKSMQLNVVGNK